MAKKSSEYWKRRFEVMEDSQYQKSQEYYETVKEQFRQAQNDIQMDMERWYDRLAKNNDVSLAGAKKLLKKNELNEFQWNVNRYIKAGEENAVDQRWMKELENASAKYHVNYLQAMKMQMQQHVEKLFTEYEGGTTEFLYKTFGDQYKHTAYEIAKGTGIGSNLTQLDTRKIDTLVKKPWAEDGANYSDRIWANKQKLTNTLNTELTQSIIRGDDPAKAIKNLSQTMDVSRSQAGRLIMTESAAVSSAAQKECFNELDVERYEIVATLDSHTSAICRGLNGKVFKLSEYEVGVTAPPFHPWCRTTTVPYFEDNKTMRAARDENGTISYIDGKMTYKEWEKNFATSQKGIANIDDNDIIRPYEIKKSREKRLEIIKRGVEEEFPIFSYDKPTNKFASFVKRVPKEEGFYDVGVHGAETYVDFFDENIDAYTLANIIRNRKDYKKGMKVRLLSCSTGKTETTGNCVAQILANELDTIVKAPTDIIYVCEDGSFEVGIHGEGFMKLFFSRKEG